MKIRKRLDDLEKLEKNLLVSWSKDNILGIRGEDR